MFVKSLSGVGDCCDDFSDACLVTQSDTVIDSSCSGKCGEWQEACSCDPLCVSAGNCCADFSQICSEYAPPSPILPEAVIEIGVLSMEKGTTLTVKLEKSFVHPIVVLSPGIIVLVFLCFSQGLCIHESFR